MHALWLKMIQFHADLYTSTDVKFTFLLGMADPWNNINSAVTSWHFVDNTDQDMLDTRGTLIIDKLVEHICWAGLLWEFLLLISGGSPYLAKCLWTLQYWQLAIDKRATSTPSPWHQWIRLFPWQVISALDTILFANTQKVQSWKVWVTR